MPALINLNSYIYFFLFQAVEFFVFAVLMFVDTVIFMIMSMFYKYNTYMNYDFNIEPEDSTSLVSASPTSPPLTPDGVDSANESSM